MNLPHASLNQDYEIILTSHEIHIFTHSHVSIVNNGVHIRSELQDGQMSLCDFEEASMK